MVSTTAGENLTETKTYGYDTLGNITYKSDVGSYAYDGARPHAVTSAGGNTYEYDDNGNMISGAGRTLTWSSFNKPTSMAKDGKTVNFTYAPDRARYLKTGSDGTKTLYLDKLYELITKGQEVTHKQFIYAGSSLVAVHVSGLDHNGSAIPVQTRYMHKDNLGSVDTITDGTGTVVDRMSFDPFGSRRQGNWREATVGINLIPILTNRGFTGHEHIDEMDLIHMNGRVYDPTLGRFLSADPHIQSPYSSQSYNRYSYVSNNPLKYTDPSGYFLGSLFKAVRGLIRDIKNIVIRALGPKLSSFIVTVASAGCGAWASVCYAAGQYDIARAYGASPKDALKGAVKAGIYHYIGENSADWVGSTFKVEQSPFKNALGNAAVGGSMSRVQGGSFRGGFIGSEAAALLKGVNAGIWGVDDTGHYDIHRMLTAAVIGGTASVLGGGKFSNGAVSAAFRQMYNGNKHLGNNLQGESDVSPKWVITIWDFEIGYGPDGPIFGFSKGKVKVGISGDDATGQVGNLRLKDGTQTYCSNGNINMCVGQKDGNGIMSLEVKRYGVGIKVSGEDPVNGEQGLLKNSLGLDPAKRRMCKQGLSRDGC